MRNNITEVPGKESGPQPDALTTEFGDQVDLVVLAVAQTAMRCRTLDTGHPVTFRKVYDEVEGEILTIRPTKTWQHKKTVYMTGNIIARRIDVPALKLKPLILIEHGMWEPGSADLPQSHSSSYYQPITAHGPRRLYQLLEDDFDSDPVLDAMRCHESGDLVQGQKILGNALCEDLRRLEIHAFLGNRLLETCPKHIGCVVDEAKKHFKVGIGIAQLSFSENINGIVPWEILDNRGFLRCLLGYGITLWRSGDFDAARNAFERLLWLNPMDNQGVRLSLAAIDAGKTWYDCEPDHNTDDPPRKEELQSRCRRPTTATSMTADRAPHSSCGRRDGCPHIPALEGRAWVG